MNAVGVGEDGTRQLREREADGPGGVPLELDHLVGAAHHGFVRLLPVLGVVVGADFGVQVAEAHTSDVHAGPHRYCTYEERTLECSYIKRIRNFSRYPY